MFPYIEKCRKKLSLPTDHPAVVIFDRFKGQCSSNTLSLLVIVPANCTDHLQSLDVSVNKAVKENIRKQFQSWYSSQVSKHTNGKVMQQVDLSMSVVKPLGATWLMNTFDYIKSNPSIIINGFKGAEALKKNHL